MVMSLCWLTSTGREPIQGRAVCGICHTCMLLALFVDGACVMLIEQVRYGLSLRACVYAGD